MKLNKVEIEKALRIIWSLCQTYEEAIKCHDALIQVFDNIEIESPEPKYLDDISSISELIRDMKILVSKKKKLFNIIFIPKSRNRVEKIVIDFLKTKENFDQKWLRANWMKTNAIISDLILYMTQKND